MKHGDFEISRRPLVWLTVALFFTVPPMLGTLSWWVPVFFVAVLLARFVMERRGWRFRSLPLKVVAVAAVFGVVQLNYHALLGLEPGLSLFMLLVAMKMLEAQTARDFHIMALLGWFLCLAGLFVSQTFGAGIYATVAFVLVLAAVVEFNRGPGASQSLSAPIRTGLGLLLKAAPLIVALFFLFPRGAGPLRFDLRRPFSARSGMSNELHPGSVSSLALSSEVAFRVEFPDGNIPPLSNMYWRGNVLMEDRGMIWKPLARDGYPRKPEQLGAGPIRQRIILQPHGENWLFALDWPADVPHNAFMTAGNILRSTKPVLTQRHYEVTSFTTNKVTELSDEERNSCLKVYAKISPNVRALAQSLAARATDPREIVKKTMEYFRKEKFTYSLSPGEYGTDALDDFLFKRRTGFCEHYAAAFATLMRLAGVPARVVTGYQGGEFNSFGRYLIVHQSDAHAWCEVWLPGSGWHRADPSAAIAPDRVSMGFSSLVDNPLNSATAGDTSGQYGGAWGRRTLLRYMQLAWDSVNYEWDSRVMGFDEETQQSFFLGLGWLDTTPVRLLEYLLLVAVLIVGLQGLVTWWRHRVAPDALRSLYEKFCIKVGALGVRREPWEGPSSFAERASQSLPAHAERIRAVADLYVALRYSAVPSGDSAERLEREIREFCGARRS